ADFRQEIIMQGTLKHPNIIQIIGISMHPLSILLELVHFGNLFDLIQDWKKSISWRFRLRVAINMANGIKFLHGIGSFPCYFILIHFQKITLSSFIWI